MARVTVEDCILKVPNRFDLVLLAGQRSREIGNGVTLTIARDNDKNPVVALREIAEGTVEIDHLKNSLIQSMQKHVSQDGPEEERGSLLSEIDFSADSAADDAALDDDEEENPEDGNEGDQDNADDDLAVLSLDEEMAEDGLNVQENVAALEAEADAIAAEALRLGTERDKD